MHNIKEIRKDFSKFQKSLEKRNLNVDLEKIQKLDEQNRDLIQKKESLEKEKKDISKSKDESLFKKSKEICLLYTSPSPRDRQKSRMPSSA